MIISELNKEAYKGKKFTLRYVTNGYYDIRPSECGFSIEYKKFDTSTEMSFDDEFFNEWLDAPVAYGIFDEGEMLGFVECTPETWNNRYRISNICVFDKKNRRRGVGSLLMNIALQNARASGARMVVLETQTCNEKAIAFYKKHGFEIIGFDLYAYTNSDPERHEIRVEMGKRL